MSLVNAQTFTEQTGANNPMDGVDVGTRSKTSLVDIDNDGDFDLFIGKDDGTIDYYENTGTATSPAYTARTGASNPFNGEDVGTRSTLGFVDIDDDGDKDCFIGESDGSFNFYRNTGTASSPTFTLVTGSSNPLNGFTTSGPGVNNDSDPQFADLDNDGDWDCISGEGDGTFRYYENTGTASSPTFTERTGASNPLNGVDIGTDTSPGFVDVDSDGDWDLFSGESLGIIAYFENTGTASSPTFTQRTGASNPMDGIDVGNTSNITFADVSGDGDTDAFVGENIGTINYFTGTDIGNVPLPVELVNFYASNNNGTVVLTWQTAAEINNDFFTIERSFDGRTFSDYGIIHSKTEYSSSIEKYEFVDEMPFPGLSYYRLKATDFNGSHEYHGVVSVNFDKTQSNIMLYPNPVVNNQLTVSYNGKQETSFVVFKITGEIIESGMIEPGLNEIQLSPSMDNGIYLFQAESDKRTIVKKFITK
jgi:hypothetical protein